MSCSYLDPASFLKLQFLFYSLSNAIWKYHLFLCSSVHDWQEQCSVLQCPLSNPVSSSMCSFKKKPYSHVMKNHLIGVGKEWWHVDVKWCLLALITYLPPARVHVYMCGVLWGKSDNATPGGDSCWEIQHDLRTVQ